MSEKEIKIKLKNRPCKYFNGNDGFCLAKDCAKCNPVNCQLYETTDEEIIKELYALLTQTKERNEQLEKFQDETWEFLNSIGISAGGELKRVKHVISTLKAEMQNRCDICDLVNENVNQGIKINELEKENKELLDDFTYYYQQSCTSDFKILELTKQLKEARETLKEFVQFRNKYKHTKINEGSLREYSKIADRIEATLSEISEVEGC